MKIKLLYSAIFAMLLIWAQGVSAQQEIMLWPKGAPGLEGKTVAEKVRISDQGDSVISSVHKPSIRPYIPTADKATGVAVIIAPGGGHSEL